MACNTRTLKFTAAVRGFHVFKTFWNPMPGEILNCHHEPGNEYDMFSIKTCNSEDVTVRHLPRKVSRATKFLLDRGPIVTARLTSDHYRRSPLIQGGLEIQCEVSITMPGSIRNHMMLDRYSHIDNAQYCEPQNEIIIGNFVLPNVNQVPAEAFVPPAPKRKKPKKSERVSLEPVGVVDIRALMRRQAELQTNRRIVNDPEPILID